MKIIREPDPVVALIQATREEYQEEWVNEMAAAGVTIELNEYAWYWISPTGQAYMFVLPKIGHEAKPQEVTA